MRAGRLRHRVTLQSVSRTEDDYGGHTEEWEDVATVWASVEGLSGTEAIRAMQTQAQVTHRVRMRYREGVTPAMRMQHDGRALEIRSVVDPDGRRRELEILAEERA